MSAPPPPPRGCGVGALQLALEAQPVAVGVPVVTGIGQPLAPRAALPGNKPLHGGDGQLALVAPPPQ